MSTDHSALCTTHIHRPKITPTCTCTQTPTYTLTHKYALKISIFTSLPPTPSHPHTPWELDKPDQPVIVHLSEEVQPPLVATVVSLVMEDVQIDESREQTYEHQGVENTVTWTMGGKKERNNVTLLDTVVYKIHPVTLPPHPHTLTHTHLYTLPFKHPHTHTPDSIST